MTENVDAKKKLKSLSQYLQTIVVGKSSQIEKVLVCLLAEGHLLLEDVPGVGKTTLASALARAIGGEFSRVQFTADLLPSDIIGTKIYRRQQEEFDFVKGPLFANVVLADELNRAPPKTQSALLQAMNDYAVSIEKQSIDLVRPFMVIATQNPKGFYGTYPLPESQRDRFLMRISLGYPDMETEMQILKKHSLAVSESLDNAILSPGEIRQVQAQAKTDVAFPEAVMAYICRLSEAVRNHSDIVLPVSPRGSISLMKAAQALAYLRDTKVVTVDLVKEIAVEVLCHRIGLKRSAGHNEEGAGRDWFVAEILQRVSVE